MKYKKCSIALPLQIKSKEFSYSQREHEHAKIKGSPCMSYIFSTVQINAICVICSYELRIFDIKEHINIEHEDEIEEQLIVWVEGKRYMLV